jgi:hypothetical protein
MSWTTLIGKMGNMKKAVKWVVCPQSKPGFVLIQSERRIAEVNIETGKAMLSNGKGHPGFTSLAKMMGAVEVDCPKEILDKLKETKAETGPIRVV